MIVRRAIAGVLVVAVLASGCTQSHPGHRGRVVAEYPRVPAKPVFGHLKHPARFVLIARQAPEPGTAATPVRNGWELGRWQLAKRSPLGFRTVNGTLYAVAGADEVALPDGAYCWHVIPGSEPIDWLSTTFLAVAAVGIVVGAYAIYWEQQNGNWFEPR